MNTVQTGLFYEADKKEATHVYHPKNFSINHPQKLTHDRC